MNDSPEQQVRLSRDGSFLVQIDEHSERVPLAQVEPSAIYPEAMRRISRNNRPESAEVRRRQEFRVWLPAMVVLWALLVRLSQPLRSCVEGGSVKQACARFTRGRRCGTRRAVVSPLRCPSRGTGRRGRG